MRAAWLLLALSSAGCVLPSYEKVPARATGAAGSTASAGPGCGLPSKLSSGCGKCLHDSCCDLAQTCAKDKDCSKDMSKAISPVTELSESFDPLLECMQRNCDDACQVSWGCVDHYTWPVPKDSYAVTAHVIDFAATPDKPLPGVTVDACQSVDPSCGTGKVASDITDENGDVTLTLAAGFDGFFEFSGGGYLPTTAQFSEPLYRNASFTQYGLTEDAIQVLALVTNVHKAGDKFDPTLGHVIFRTQNCLPLRFLQRDEPPHSETGGVSVSIEPNAGASEIFYTDKSGSVSLSLDATTSNAFGGTFNLAANSHTLTGTDAATGHTLESGTMVIRASTVGFMYLVPSATR